MNCPKNLYNDLTRACCQSCPIRGGIKVSDNWYSVPSAVSNPESPAFGQDTHRINNAVWRKTLFRDAERKHSNGYHKTPRTAGIPECALVAYLDYQKQCKDGIINRKTGQLFQQGIDDGVEASTNGKIYKKPRVLEALAWRDWCKIHRPADIENNRDIAARTNVSAWYVGYVDKERKGEG